MRTLRIGWILSVMVATVFWASGCGEVAPIGNGPDEQAELSSGSFVEDACLRQGPLLVIWNERLRDEQLIEQYTPTMRFCFRTDPVCGRVHLSQIGFQVLGTADSKRWYATLDTSYNGTGGHFHLGDERGQGIDLIREAGNRQYLGHQSAPIETGGEACGMLFADTRDQRSGQDFWIILNRFSLTRDSDNRTFDVSGGNRLYGLYARTRLTTRLR